MSFDTVAPHYDRLERWFSRGQMHAARVAHLDSIARCRHGLLLGEGPGRFLAALADRFPEARFTCVDASEQMLELASARLPVEHRDRVDFVHADVRNGLQLKAPADLIASHFFFDCFDAGELALIIPSIASLAAPVANWLVSDFQIPSSGFARWRAKVIVGGLYGFFRFAARLKAKQLVPPDSWLEAAGFELRQRVEFEGRLLFSDWWHADQTLL